MNVTLSIIFITYNRSDLLCRSLSSIKDYIDNINIFREYIVSDDASTLAHQKIINSLPFDKILLAPQNQGIGANVNKGIKASEFDYVFQIQDDWEYLGDISVLKCCLEILDKNPNIGILQLTPVHSDLPAERHVLGSTEFKVFKNDGLPWLRDCSVRPYSDGPHIKRREFIKDLGPYLEKVPMGICENDFKRRVARQQKWQVAQLNAPSLFTHLGGDASLNPGGKRHPVVNALLKVPLIGNALEKATRRTYIFLDHTAAVLWSSLRRG
ncbi:glycosyltransferase [Polaromonas sp. CG_23.6]|uniref:glycosyltransferase family 2 protein n=1 Tax=Polaromonas sp. CG_23.6 TaxID=2760709 RepID=UPI002474553B|nr:glycosyltransferase [Polaromonas sp. CG_23.6]MDH6185996.1 glycosyltransferase involved in cell wall biosynthesis [Polaromonas sp. CG_23.6]